MAARTERVDGDNKGGGSHQEDLGERQRRNHVVTACTVGEDLPPELQRIQYERSSRHDAQGAHERANPGHQTDGGPITEERANDVNQEKSQQNRRRGTSRSRDDAHPPLRIAGGIGPRTRRDFHERDEKHQGGDDIRRGPHPAEFRGERHNESWLEERTTFDKFSMQIRPTVRHRLFESGIEAWRLREKFSRTSYSITPDPMEMHPRVARPSHPGGLAARTSSERFGSCGRVLLLILMCGASSGCDSYVRRHVDQGDVHFKDRKYREAVAEYVKAVRFSSDDPHILRQLGLAHFNLGEPDDAFAYLSKAAALNPGDPEVRIGLGKIYLANRRPDEALREAKLVLAADSGNADALDLLAVAYLNQNDPANAIKAHRRLVERFPKSAERHFALGVSLMAGQQASEARRALETALTLAPEHFEAARMLVNLDLLEKRPDDALARVQKQIALAGRSAKLVLLLAEVQGARGNQAGAEEAYQEAIRLDPSHADASVALANFYVTSGRLDQALPVIESALKTEKSPAAYQLRGVIQQSKGDVQGARQSYEAALELNPRYVEAANNLAWLLSEKLGEHQKAFGIAQSAYQSMPNDPHIADTFGWIVFRLGDFKSAVTLLTASAEKLPNSPGIQYHLGMALLGSNDSTGARRALTRAVNSPTPFVEKDAAQKALAALK